MAAEHGDHTVPQMMKELVEEQRSYHQKECSNTPLQLHVFQLQGLESLREMLQDVAHSAWFLFAFIYHTAFRRGPV